MMQLLEELPWPYKIIIINLIVGGFVQLAIN